jgi:hypothetical protein
VLVALMYAHCSIHDNTWGGGGDWPTHAHCLHTRVSVETLM